MQASLILFSFFLILLLTLPYSYRYAISFVSSIFQIYTLPLFGFYPTVAMVSTFSLSAEVIKLRNFLLKPPILYLILLILTQILSLAWSSDIKLGLATIYYELPFLIMYFATIHIYKKNPEYLIKIIKIYAIFSLVPLLLNLTFNLSHNLNLHYLNSKFAELFINPNTLTWFHNLPNTNHWLGKPRGFFIDPNVGGAYFGICSLLLGGMGFYYRSSFLKTIAILHIIGLMLSFSTASWFFMALFSTILFGKYFTEYPLPFIHKKIKSLRIYYLSLAFLSSVTLISFPILLNTLLFKLHTRIIFWQVTAKMVHGNLVKGLGFGGWDNLYMFYRHQINDPDKILNDNFPPHNTLIGLWSQSGFFAVIFASMFMASVMFLLSKIYKNAKTFHEKFYILSISLGILWIFAHGMGENWGPVGEIHMQPIFASIFALLMSKYYFKHE